MSEAHPDTKTAKNTTHKKQTETNFRRMVSAPFLPTQSDDKYVGNLID
jgi:hypothetical protein